MTGITKTNKSSILSIHLHKYLNTNLPGVIETGITKSNTVKVREEKNQLLYAIHGILVEFCFTDAVICKKYSRTHPATEKRMENII